jgi:cation-transporting ATPase 13A3/4/5
MLINPLNKDDNLESYEDSALFLVGNFQYLIVAAAFSIGKPFREPIYTNFYFMGVYVVIFMYSVALLVSSNESFI